MHPLDSQVRHGRGGGGEEEGRARHLSAQRAASVLRRRLLGRHVRAPTRRRKFVTPFRPGRPCLPGGRGTARRAPSAVEWSGGRIAAPPLRASRFLIAFLRCALPRPPPHHIAFNFLDMVRLAMRASSPALLRPALPRKRSRRLGLAGKKGARSRLPREIGCAPQLVRGSGWRRGALPATLGPRIRPQPARRGAAQGRPNAAACLASAPRPYSPPFGCAPGTAAGRRAWL